MLPLLSAFGKYILFHLYADDMQLYSHMTFLQLNERKSILSFFLGLCLQVSEIWVQFSESALQFDKLINSVISSSISHIRLMVIGFFYLRVHRSSPTRPQLLHNSAAGLHWYQDERPYLPGTGLPSLVTSKI